MTDKWQWIGACLAALAVSMAAAQSGPPREAVVRHMHEHVATVDALRSAIIAGDLEGVRAPATSLVTHEAVSQLPAQWAGYVQSLRANARRVQVSRSLVAAAYATSAMATACADCHRANQVTFEFPAAKAPPEHKEDMPTHMQRHRWAADRMWEGLIGPSDKAWHQGVDMLMDVPLEPAEMGATPSNEQRELARMALEVHLIGSRGAVADEPEHRSQLYSEYLSLCVDCHTTLERGPVK